MYMIRCWGGGVLFVFMKNGGGGAFCIYEKWGAFCIYEKWGGGFCIYEKKGAFCIY